MFFLNRRFVLFTAGFIFIVVTKAAANITFLVLIIINSSYLQAQPGPDRPVTGESRDNTEATKSTDILVGFSWQDAGSEDVRRPFRYIEVGIGRSIQQYGYLLPSNFGMYIAEEIYIGKGPNVYGTKIGAYLHSLFDIGMAVIYYTDFTKGNFKFRPELGIGILNFRAVAGINIPTTDNKTFELLKKNYGQISLQLFIPVKQTEVRRTKGNIFRQFFK